MKVLILGASGRIGSRLVTEMLHRGYEVTAFIHGPNHFRKQDKLHIIRGDIHSAADIEKVLKHNDVVLSALGSWGTQVHDILSTAMKNVVPLMEKHGKKRIVSLTGADARDVGDKPSRLQHLSYKILGHAAGAIIQDAEEHIRILRKSNLDWTVLRSPVMVDNDNHRTFQLTDELVMPWHTISRQSVVLAMADMVEGRTYLKRSPVISRA
ncbi:NAD(P)H-binding protein [Candidatus Saccharibacteria bacterium]|nr:NAD(P)H-binding protein [Candidatus Saccharibacteria bacterium]